MGAVRAARRRVESDTSLVRLCARGLAPAYIRKSTTGRLAWAWTGR